MLKRLYVDNFRTLVNIDIEFDRLTLLLGPNGSGKTTVFDIIRLLRDFIAGRQTTAESFSPATLTRWQQRSIQIFEIALAGQDGDFTYRLEIEHERHGQRCRVKSERLSHQGKVLYESSLESDQLRAQLYRDDGTRGPEVLADWTRSGLAPIQPRPDNRLLTWFKDRMGRVAVLRFAPENMTGRAVGESSVLAPDAANFVEWFRYVSGLDMDLTSRLRPVLEDVLSGYDGLSLVPDGAEAKLLKIRIKTGETSGSRPSAHEYLFDELSDGQRVLFALYTLLLVSENDCTLCLDEPENFTALREIQPWLNMLIDRTQTHPCQAVLISHHPELINALAVGAGRWFDRTEEGPTRSQAISDDATGLPVAELVARGWLHAR